MAANLYKLGQNYSDKIKPLANEIKSCSIGLFFIAQNLQKP